MKRIAACLALVAALLLFLGPLAAAQSAIGNFVSLYLNGNRVIATSGTATVTVPNSTDTLVGKATTDTLTNKTLNVESTGNVVTVTRPLLFPVALCQNATAVGLWSTPTSNAAAFACNTGTNTQKGVLEFADDGATTLSAQASTWLPADFTGTVDARIRWYTAATSGNVVWSLATICVADAETSDPAFNTASTVTDAAKGTTLQDNDAAITGLTTTGCAAGELLYLKLSRDPAAGGDTLSATAVVRFVELMVRRAM